MGGLAKAALRIGPRTFLECLVNALRGAGVARVGVVVGPYRDELLPLVLGCGAEPVFHPPATDPSLVDSQRLALQAHVSRHPGHDLLLMPGDLPLLHVGNVEPLLQAWKSRADSVQALVPTVEGQPGHPVFLSWQAITAIDKAPPTFGVRDWMGLHAAHVWRLPCEDRAYVTDVDQPSDLDRVRSERYAQVRVPVSLPVSVQVQVQVHLPAS